LAAPSRSRRRHRRFPTTNTHRSRPESERDRYGNVAKYDDLDHRRKAEIKRLEALLKKLEAENRALKERLKRYEAALQNKLGYI
jgi:predicted RNase H-like nuclease (RuvC/YqgF family)